MRRKRERNPINPKRALGYMTEQLPNGRYWTFVAKPFHHRCYGAGTTHARLSDAERYMRDVLSRYWDYRGHIYRTNEDDADNYRSREVVVETLDE